MSTALRLGVVLGVFALLAGAVLWRHLPAPRGVGKPAPEFSLPTLAGDTQTLASLRGRVVVVNFWATWCPPCVAEMPSLQKLHEALHADGLSVVAISVDDDRGALERFVRAHGLTLPILHDGQRRAAAAYGVTGYPETFVVDREGRLLEHYAGPALWHTPEALAHFRSVLGVHGATEAQSTQRTDLISHEDTKTRRTTAQWATEITARQSRNQTAGQATERTEVTENGRVGHEGTKTRRVRGRGRFRSRGRGRGRPWVLYWLREGRSETQDEAARMAPTR